MEGEEDEAAESAWGNFESHVALIEALKEARGEAPRSAAHVGVASRSPDASCPRAPLGASGRSLVEPASFGVSPAGVTGSSSTLTLKESEAEQVRGARACELRVCMTVPFDHAYDCAL